MRKGSIAEAREMNVKSSNNRKPTDRGAGGCEVDTVLRSFWMLRTQAALRVRGDFPSTVDNQKKSCSIY